MGIVGEYCNRRYTNSGTGAGYLFGYDNNTNKGPCDRTTACPICNEIVAKGNDNRVELDYRIWHWYCLTKPGARKNGAKQYFVKFKNRLEELRNIVSRTYDQEFELTKLEELLL